jgi:hypothetical protein
MPISKVTVRILLNDLRVTIRVTLSEAVANVEAISHSVDTLLDNLNALRTFKP